MKSAIVYASTHLGNTKKLIDCIEKECDIDIIDATKTKEADLSEYDLIGFASGIYAGKYHKAVIDFAKNNLVTGKSVFFLFTSAMNSKKYDRSIREAIEDKRVNVVGSLGIRAMTTFGPFKLIGGAPKGHPSDKDMERTVEFVKKLTKS